MVAWQPVGISMGVFDMCHRYVAPNVLTLVSSQAILSPPFLLSCKNKKKTKTDRNRYLKERKQFGVPLAAFQLNQEKLARMLGNVQSMVLVGWRLCKLYESGKMTPGHASLGKVCSVFCRLGWHGRLSL